MQYKYNVGVYGGSFNPLHLGHVDCILKAASLCSDLVLVLSVAPHRKEVDLRVRYQWLRQLTMHLSNVRIMILEDITPSKSLYTREQALADSEKVKAFAGKKIDVTFCGSDYNESSFWFTCYPECEHVVFERNSISSTELRRDIYGHFEWLPLVTRPYFTKKVLLIGSESTGKSTLTINLAAHFNTNYIDEAGRTVSERIGNDRMMTPSDFTEILLQHKLNEMNAIHGSNKVLFVDTDALVTEFYLHFLEFRSDSGNLALADAINAVNQYDLILFLEPDVAFVQDGDRSPVIEADREKYSSRMKALLTSHGKSFISISGSYPERFDSAVKYVQEILVPEQSFYRLTD